ncbi:MAG TPA: hypothetical protein VHU13_08325 [Solirubrobacteraceae bacterium]|jgi:hypothetical protein|nr:hypothetical protein [Solirubrobacteraceae bacterium]
MVGKNRRFSVRWLLAAIVLVGVAGAAVAVADPDGSGSTRRRASAGDATAPAGTGACGAAAAQTVAAVELHVAKRIYAGEAGGGEVAEDAAHITASRELTEAVAAGNQPAVYAAVHRIVYTPHWHIVRLRVLSRGRVLADVGGPYIIAPIAGALRQGARKVGSYVMSVQDDVGYVKLVTRFTGVPIDVYGTPRPAEGFVLGTLQPAPPLPADGASVRVRGVRYLARVIKVRAFPDGPLKAVLLLPPPTQALAAQSCRAVRHATWGSVLKDVAARFSPLPSHYQDLAGTLQGATGGVVFVRDGSTQIAGLTAGPRHLPKSGPVRYRRRTWQVYSWEPYPPARIYFLAPS